MLTVAARAYLILQVFDYVHRSPEPVRFFSLRKDLEDLAAWPEFREAAIKDPRFLVVGDCIDIATAGIHVSCAEEEIVLQTVDLLWVPMTDQTLTRLVRRLRPDLPDEVDPIARALATGRVFRPRNCHIALLSWLKDARPLPRPDVFLPGFEAAAAEILEQAGEPLGAANLAATLAEQFDLSIKEAYTALAENPSLLLLPDGTISLYDLVADEVWHILNQEDRGYNYEQTKTAVPLPGQDQPDAVAGGQAAGQSELTKLITDEVKKTDYVYITVTAAQLEAGCLNDLRLGLMLPDYPMVQVLKWHGQDATAWYNADYFTIYGLTPWLAAQNVQPGDRVLVRALPDCLQGSVQKAAIHSPASATPGKVGRPGIKRRSLLAAVKDILISAGGTLDQDELIALLNEEDQEITWSEVEPLFERFSFLRYGQGHCHLVSQGEHLKPADPGNRLVEARVLSILSNALKGLLLRKKNIILQGAPGVGKTFAAQRLAFSVMGEKDISRVKVVQFHQSYSYEDFVIGYRPDGTNFKLAVGPFYEFCKRAEEDDERPYFFVVDEINRGNLSKIFGELLMLIESDKRGEKYLRQFSCAVWEVK